MVGIGGEVGCIQYGREDGNPPYWMAASPATKTKAGLFEFLNADTPTPVPARYCLPFDALKDIVVHFVNTGLRTPAVDWEEI
jgi:Immunity protein Imm1